MNAPAGICKPCECKKAKTRLAKLEEIERKADFADAAYAAEDGKAPAELHGYKNISNDPAALARHGLKPEELKIDGTNFTAVVYEKGDQTIVAFKGTTSWLGSDMKANAQQAFDIRNGVTDSPNEYYSRAQLISTKMANHAAANGAPLPEFVGHSLGGGLASAAAAASGSPATTFNPAGLNPATLAAPMSGGPVTAVKVRGEAVSGLVNKIPGLPDAYGTEEVLLDPEPHFGRDVVMTVAGAVLGGSGGALAAELIRSGLLHMMANVRGGIKQEKKKATKAIERYCG